MRTCHGMGRRARGKGRNPARGRYSTHGRRALHSARLWSIGIAPQLLVAVGSGPHRLARRLAGRQHSWRARVTSGATRGRYRARSGEFPRLS